MPKGQGQKQKKRMKKLRKDKARKKSIQGNSPTSSRNLIKKAATFPVKDCWINTGWDQQDSTGLTRIIITRQQPDGLLVFGSFMVDMLLLGVKDAHAEAHVPSSKIKEMLTYVYPDTVPEPCDLTLAHQIIYQSIDYAAEYEMKPHKDFKLAKHLLETRGTYPETHSLTFGKDGKPLFISGPYDDADLIINKLERTAGSGNYDYIVGLGPEMSDDMLFIDDMDTAE
jgi:hypothetical protein